MAGKSKNATKAAEKIEKVVVEEEHEQEEHEQEDNESVVEESEQEGGNEKPAKKAAKKVAAKKGTKAPPKKAVKQSIKQKGGNAAAKTKSGEPKRFFKCEYNGKSFGRYSGQKPKQAANKALTSILRSYVGTDKKNKDKCLHKLFKFKMVECTRNRKGNKECEYEGERTKLETPVTVTVKSDKGDRKILYQYQNKLKKVKEVAATEEQQEGGEKKVKKAVAAKKALPAPAKKKAVAKKAPVKAKKAKNDE